MSDSGYSERLMAQLDGAKLVKYDGDGYLLAWFGGHGVHAYDGSGQEVDYWNTGDFADNDASREEVEESMSAWILGVSEAEIGSEEIREALRVDGYSAGVASGSWVIDGNTPETDAREIVRMFDDGDPLIYDAMPEPLSGEWADGPAPGDVLESAGVKVDSLGPEEASELLNEWEDGFREGWEHEVRRSATAMLPDSEESETTREAV